MSLKADVDVALGRRAAMGVRRLLPDTDRSKEAHTARSMSDRSRPIVVVHETHKPVIPTAGPLRNLTDELRAQFGLSGHPCIVAHSALASAFRIHQPIGAIAQRRTLGNGPRHSKRNSRYHPSVNHPELRRCDVVGCRSNRAATPPATSPCRRVDNHRCPARPHERRASCVSWTSCEASRAPLTDSAARGGIPERLSSAYQHS